MCKCNIIDEKLKCRNKYFLCIFKINNTYIAPIFTVQTLIIRLICRQTDALTISRKILLNWLDCTCNGVSAAPDAEIQSLSLSIKRKRIDTFVLDYVNLV